MIRNLLIAEYNKLKRICLWIPAISSVIFILFTCLEWRLYFKQGEAGVYAGFNVMYLFLSFTMLLTISLLASIVAETEHQAQGWKLLFSMPVSRAGLFLCKAVWIGALMVEACMLIIAGVSLIWVVYTSEPLPFAFLAKQVGGSLLASLPVLAIQLFVSIRVSNQTFPLALGIIGAISSLFIGRSGGDWTRFIPWAYPPMSSPFIPGYTSWLTLAVALGMLLLGIGSLLYDKTNK